MRTIKLDENWDIGIDNFFNLSMIDSNERLAQDVATSVRVFKSEMGFDTSRGVEYNKPDENRQVLNREMNRQADLIEGVADSMVVFEELVDRTLKPVIYITNTEGEQITVGE